MVIVDEIMNRHDRMAARRATWEPVWERAAQLVLPRISGFQTKHTPGENLSNNQYDAFPMLALERFAAAIEAASMPRHNRWHLMSTGVRELDARHDVKVYLQEFNTMLWDERNTPRANFALPAHESRIMLGSMGTKTLLVEAHPKGGLRYRGIHLRDTYLAEDAFGFVDTVHRKFELSTRHVVQMFGDEAPEKIRTEYDKGISKQHEFLHCVMPREDYDRKALDDNGKPWRGVYLHVDSRKVVRDEGYYENPYIVSRYATGIGEVYGRSPIIQLLPDISMLNEMRKTVIQAAQSTTDPAILLHADAPEFDRAPGTQNYGQLDDNGRPIAVPFNSGARPDIGLEMIADTRNQIDDGLMGVYFRVLLENPSMTATQAMLLAQQQGQMAAPIVGRLQTEWAGPMIKRESGILHRQGKHPPIPPALQEYFNETGKGLEITYVSPMTRAIMSEDAIGIMKSMEMLAPLAQLDPSVYDVIDKKEAARIVMEANGVPARALLDKEDVAAKEEQTQQAQMAQNMLQAAPVAADAVKKMAEAQAISGASGPGAM